MRTAATLIRVVLIGILCGLALAYFDSPPACHTDSECARAFPGTNGDPSE